MDLEYVRASDITSAIDVDELTAVEVANAFLDVIADVDDDINAFISVRADQAIDSAKAVDEKKNSGLLKGVPIALKDNFSLVGEIMTCGSKMLEQYRAPYSATVVEKIEKEGGLILGKTNMDEFAMGSTNRTSFFGPVKNPLNKNLISGGSSGGSAAAVAAGETLVSLGTDTGGSVRQPAAFCGVVGYKPTYGMISRYGVVSMANTFDTVGIIGRKVKDVALVYAAIKGYDEKDATSIKSTTEEIPSWILEDQDDTYHWEKLKIAIPKELTDSKLDPVILVGFNQAVNLLSQQGVSIEYVDIPSLNFAVETYHILVNGEISANLSRYDGLRYGHRAKEYNDVDEMFTLSRSEGFGAEVKRRILVGTHLLSLDLVEDYYVKAQKIRRIIKNEWENLLNDYDYVMLPTSPMMPFAIEESKTPVEIYEADRYTVIANLTGMPAISIPKSMDDEKVGIQLVGKAFDDFSLLELSHAMEEVFHDEL